ncbi:MAG: radical SAM protein [Candidatus Latescibacterota bacterium]
MRKAADRNIPVSAHLELTHTCNLRCVHCYVTQQKKKKELTGVAFRRILHQLAEEGTLYLGMTGGEILGRKDFFELATYARKKGFALRLFTNATLIDREVAGRIADLNPLTVEVSLYGVTPEVHESVTRVPGSYARTLWGIRCMAALGRNLVIKSCIMSQNVSEIRQLKNFAAELGVGFRSNPMLSPGSEGSKAPLQFRITDRELTEYFQEYDREWASKVPAQNEPVCNAARGVVAINPHGEVFPCVQIPVKSGDLRQQSFHEIWHNSPELRRFRSLTLSKLTDCSTCKDISYCNPCPGLALVEEGDVLRSASESCRQARVRKSVLTRSIG